MGVIDYIWMLHRYLMCDMRYVRGVLLAFVLRYYT